MWKTTPITLLFLGSLIPCLDPPGVLSFNWNFSNTLAILMSAFLGFLLQWSGALALGWVILFILLNHPKQCPPLCVCVCVCICLGWGDVLGFGKYMSFSHCLHLWSILDCLVFLDWVTHGEYLGKLNYCSWVKDFKKEKCNSVHHSWKSHIRCCSLKMII